jgi:hypothetical protein
MTEKKITGGCLCGRVRYEATGDALFSALCYCKDRQRASGSGHVPIMGMLKECFSTTGTPKAYGNKADSGHMAVRNFCPDCGSLLFGTPEAAPDMVTIYAGSLDDPDVFEPQIAQFVRSRHAWDTSGAGLPEFDGAAFPPEG